MQACLVRDSDSRYLHIYSFSLDNVGEATQQVCLKETVDTSKDTRNPWLRAWLGFSLRSVFPGCLVPWLWGEVFTETVTRRGGGNECKEKGSGTGQFGDPGL